MKPAFGLSLAAAILAASSGLALADTIQLGSFANGAASMGNTNTAMNYAGFSALSTTPGSGTASTFTLSPGGVWGGPVANSTWVGFAANAGPGGGLNPALGYYTFTTTFTALPSVLYTGAFSILADDTAEVLLNGSVLIPFGTLGGDAHCADVGPSCLVADNVPVSGVSFLSGTNANKLTFVVRQAGTLSSDPSGVDFAATLTSSSVPEPSSLMLMALGLLGIGGGTVGRRLLARNPTRN
jgi:hypothetical protein